MIQRQNDIALSRMFIGFMHSNCPWPKVYLWSAVWWRVHAKESAIPHECIQTAKTQLRLYKDIMARPKHYERLRDVRSDFSIYLDG